MILWLHETDDQERISLLMRCDAVTGDCERVREARPRGAGLR